jgi:hypothetical protein
MICDDWGDKNGEWDNDDDEDDDGEHKLS